MTTTALAHYRPEAGISAAPVIFSFASPAVGVYLQFPSLDPGFANLARVENHPVRS
jgi:hypothetical protein